ncbi:hypothetical protein ACF0H5_015923 [Mactra antiquata]
MVVKQFETAKFDCEYLVKWRDFHACDATWEPENHLPPQIIDNHVPAQIPHHKIRHISETFEKHIRTRLRRKSSKFVMNCDLDVFRYMFDTDDTTLICTLNDFKKFELPEHWFYELGHDGFDKKIRFPMKITARVQMSKTYVKINGKLELKITPLERVMVFCCPEACSFSDI